MALRANLWVIVLAGGEGRRLSAFTTDPSGLPVPKQFCSFGEGTCMLRWALERAERLAPRERIVVVVSSEHRRFWEHELADLPRENVIVQPQRRGTASGILLPLLHVLRRDPAALVALLPSDHHVDDEETVRRAFERAVRAARQDPERVVLLAVSPESPDPEYGWILPSRAGDGRTRRVAAFVEKPDAATAVRLMRVGALWNSFMLVASGSTLLELTARALPDLVRAFPKEARDLEGEKLRAIHAALPEHDFSRDVLEQAADRLNVLSVPRCGWTDLGTPARLERFLARRGPLILSLSKDDRLRTVGALRSS